MASHQITSGNCPYGFALPKGGRRPFQTYEFITVSCSLDTQFESAQYVDCEQRGAFWDSRCAVHNHNSFIE